MKPRVFAFLALAVALLLVSMIPAAAAPVAQEPPDPPAMPTQPRQARPERPPAHQPQRSRGPEADESRPEPEAGGDPRLAARRAEQEARRQAQQPAPALAPQSFSAGPQLPITAGPERIPAAVLPDSNDSSWAPSVSADGRFTAFYSTASNLAPGDNDAQPDVFVYDGQTGDLELVSVPQGGGDIWGYFNNPSISDDGRYVAFDGWTNDLVPGEVEWTSDIYVLDRNDGSIVRISDAFDGSESDGNSYQPAISPDGGFVAFYSYATDLVTDDNNGMADLFLHDIAAGTTVRVSVSSGEAEANDESYFGRVSENGLFVSFYSYASNLVAGDTNGYVDVFVRDVTSGTTERVSVGTGVPGTQANGESYANDISADGRYVAFESDADNLIDEDENGCTDIFVRDRVNQTTARVSLDENGYEADDCSYYPSLSGDGLSVAFESYAGLVAADFNGDGDIYRRTWDTGAVVRATVDSGGSNPNNYSSGAALAADASAVAFVSFATDLVANDSNEAGDVFLRELPGGPTTLLSADDVPFTEPNNASYHPVVSADGRYVAFESSANNLVPGDGRDWDVFLYDRQLDETAIVSLRYWGPSTNSGAYEPDISDDGNRIAYRSYDNNIVEDDENGYTDVFVYDRLAGSTTRVSVASAGSESNEASYAPAISGDGNVVAFESYADNLVAGDNNGVNDIFVHDLTTGETTRVSVSSTGEEGDGDAYDPALSEDGRYVVFESYAGNLVDNDFNGTNDVFVHDRDTGQTTLVSVTPWDEAAAYDSWGASISADGRYVAFASSSYDLVDGDWNGAYNIFVRDLWVGVTVKVTHAPDGGPTDNGSWLPDLSADGRYVTFESVASNLVADDTNGERDAFLYDRLTGETARLSESAGGDEGNETSYDPVISTDGTTPVFTSEASNLVPGDTYGYADTFVVEQDTDDTLYSVSGTVLDEYGDPLEGAVVAPVGAPGNFAASDGDGNYTLWLPPGTYALSASMSEYNFLPETQSVTVGPNETGIDFTGIYSNYRLLYSWVTEDAYVDQARKTTNLGSATILRVKNASADMNAYLKFDVVGLDPLPGTCRRYGYTWLRTFVKEPSTDGGSIYAVGNGWTEGTINWNNAPVIAGTPVGAFGAVADETDEYAEITHPIESDGIYSFAIRNNSSNSVDYGSWEGGYSALLGVNYIQDTIRKPTANMDFPYRSGVAPFTLRFNSEASTGCPTAWHWDFDDGSTSNEQNPTHTFTAVGDYNVTLTVTNDLGSSSRTETIHVLGLPTSFYISPATNATIGGIPAQAADILLYEKPANTWTMVYDGSVHGTLKNISAFSHDDWDGSLYLVFSANQVIPGLGTATPRDIVHFIPDDPWTFPLGAGEYEWYRRGNAPGVGLTTTSEAIDALDTGIDDLVSTVGAAALPTVPVLKPADEDLVLWPTWAGGWNHLALDGSRIPGLAAEDINGVWHDPDTGDLYVTILGPFNLGGIAGDGKSIIRLNPNGGSTWQASTNWTPSLVPWLAPGAVFGSTIDAIELER